MNHQDRIMMEDQDHTEDQDYKEDQDHMEDQDHVEDQDHMEDQDHKVDQGHTDIVRIFSHFTCLVGFTRNLNSEGVRYTSGGHYAVDTLSYVRTQFWGCNVYQVSWLAYVLRLAVNFYTISRAQSVQYLKSTQSVMHVMHVMTHDFFRRPMVFIPMLPTVRLPPTHTLGPDSRVKPTHIPGSGLFSLSNPCLATPHSQQ